MPATDAEADAHSRAARCASECWAPVLQGRRHLKKSDVQGVVSRFRSLRRRAGRRVVETELSREELAEVLGLDDAGADVGPIFEALISRGGPGGGEGGGGRVLPCDLRLLLVVLAGLTKAKAADRMRFAAMLLDERSRGYLLEDQLALILRANALHSSSARDDFAAQARALISRVEAARGAELPDAEGGSGITHDELVEAVRRFPGDVFPADGHQPIDLDGSQALAAQQLPARDEAPPEPPAEPPEPPAAQAGPPEPPARPQQQLGPPEEPLERMPRPEPPRPSEPRERSQQPERPAEPSQPRGPGAGAAAGGAGGAAAASPREAAAAGSEGAAEGARRGGAPPGLPPAEEAPGGLADAGTAAQDLAEPAAAGGAGDGPGPLAADLCEAEEAPAPTGRRDGGDALRAAAAASEGPEAHGGLGVGREDPGPSLAAGPAPQEGAGGPGAPAAARERPRPATGPLLGQRPSGSDHAPPEQPRAATGGPAGAGAPEAATLRQGTADRARLLAARAARVIESPPGTGAAAAAGPEREDLRQAPLSQRGGAAAPPAGWEAQPPPPPSARGGAAAVQPPPTPPPRPPAGPATPRAPGTPPPGATPRGSQGASRSARSPLRAVAPDFRRLPLTPGRLELGPERLLPPPPPPACAQAAPEPPPLSERSRSPTPRGRARDGAGGAQAAPPLQPLVESDAAAPTRQAVSPPAWISPPRPPMPALPGQMPSQPSSPQPAPPAGPAASRGSGIDPASLRLDLSRVAAGRAPLPEALRRGASPSGSASSSSSRSGSLSSCRTPPLQPSPEPRGPKGPPPDELDDALARLELGPEPPAEEPLALPLGDRDGRGPQDDRLADQLIDEPETTQWTFGRYLKHKQRRRLLEICGGGSSGTKDSSRGCVSVLGCVLVNLGFLLFFGYRAHGPGSARARAGEGEIVVSEDVIPAFGVILMLGGCAALCHCACFSGVDRGVQEQDAGPGPPGWARALARRRAPGTVASLACAAGLLALGAGRRGLGWRGASAEAPAGVLFGQKEAHEADGDVQKAACDAVNAVFAKVVVPKLNSKTIPQTIDKIGYNPMQQVVSSESMQVTDLTGLINFTITSLTASKVVTNSSVAVSTGFSTTATAYMEMEASVPVTMTAHAELEKGGKSGDKSEQKSHRRRLEDSSNSSDVEFDGTANIKNLKVKMPITGVVTITSGSSLNASNIVANMKHMTIESAKSGIPDIGFDLSLQCQRRLKLMDDMAHDATDDAKKGAEDAGKDAAKDTHMECHTASVGLEAAKPAIDLVMDDKFTSIIQNVLNKQLPMTLGEPKDENKVSGSMKIDVSGGRRLSPDADPSSAASAFLANNTTKLAVDEALAELANIPSSGVSTNFVLDERGGIDYFYNLSTPGGDADAYDVREVLMNHSDEEVSDKITQHLWNYDASWDVRASVAYASVVEPFRWRLGSDEPDHAQPTPWRKWWPQISILAAVLLVGLVAMLTRCSQGKGRTRAVPQLGADRRPRARGSPAGAAPGTPQRRAPPLHTSPAAPAPPVLQGAATPGPGSFLPPPGPVVQGPAQYGQQVPGPVPLPGGPPGFSYGQLPSYVQPQSQYHVQGPWPPPQNQAAVVHMQPQSPYSQSQPSYSPGYAPCPAGAASGCGGCGGAPVLWGGYGPVPAGPLR